MQHTVSLLMHYLNDRFLFLCHHNNNKKPNGNIGICIVVAHEMNIICAQRWKPKRRNNIYNGKKNRNTVHSDW